MNHPPAAANREVLRMPPRQRATRIAFVAFALLALLLWVACAVSYFVELSTFTKSAVRPRSPAALAVAGANTTMNIERDESHFMLGHGLVAIYSNTVYSSTFNSPTSDLNSRVLAWLTVDNMFPGLWRIDWYAPGPLIGVKVWFLAAICTVPALALLLMLRRFVPPGHCRRCRYDLRGLAGDKCPECGASMNSTV